MPGKEMESAKAVIGPGSGSAATQQEAGFRIMGSCATAWFRYIRQPESEFLKGAESSAGVPPALPLSVGERLGSQN